MYRKVCKKWGNDYRKLRLKSFFLGSTNISRCLFLSSISNLQRIMAACNIYTYLQRHGDKERPFSKLIEFHCSLLLSLSLSAFFYCISGFSFLWHIVISHRSWVGVYKDRQNCSDIQMLLPEIHLSFWLASFRPPTLCQNWNRELFKDLKKRLMHDIPGAIISQVIPNEDTLFSNKRK